AGGSAPPPPTCTPASPTLTLSPSSQQGDAGSALSYSLTVTNNDSSACASSTFDLSATVPSGFSQSLNQASLTIAPNESAQATIAVTSSASSPAGSYDFSVSGVNSQNSSYSGSASAAYVVSGESSNLKLTISPQDAIFLYNSERYADFTIELLNGSRGIPNNTLNISLTGPITYNTSISSGATGAIRFGILLNRAIPMGLYKMTISSDYLGSNVVGETNFAVVP
ncbi:MAG TPA: NEW3 domain-containing protein, partial [Myxococcota bacterium]|nr:NEW3 domain-containing protein [Myxococcota bacterium]